MIKTLRAVQRSDKEPFQVPRSAQDTIPIKRIWKDGIFQVGNKYSRTYRFSDINYSVSSKEGQQEMLLKYCELLNSLEVGATTKITVNNRRMHRGSFEKNLLALKDDVLDPMRKEYNGILLNSAASGNGIVQEKYITVSAVKASYEEARTFFRRITVELETHFAGLSSRLTELDATERLRIFHDFFRSGREEEFHFDLKEQMRRGHFFKDLICPDGVQFRKDSMRLGKKFARVLYLSEYPSFLKDSMLSEMCELNRNLMFSVDIIPIPTDEAVKEVERKLLGTETDITNWQRKQNQNNNFSAVVPYDLEQQRQESKEFLDDLTNRDQRMLFASVTLVHMADTLKQLNSDTEALLSIGRKYICQFEVLKFQQAAGLDTALPYGLRKTEALRTLTTEATAALMPFRAQEIDHRNGIYCGQNAISKNLMFVDREELLNGNGFILGVSGSGKSFSAKEQILQYALKGDCDVIVIDPEREYSPLVNALGGEVIRIAAESKNHINAFDMSSGAEESDNPITVKSEFVLSLCEQLIGNGVITQTQRSIIDRCTVNVCLPYVNGGFTGTPPTLLDFYRELKKQPEKEAKQVALALEMYTEGSLNTFAQQTNVNMASPLLCFDIRDLSSSLKKVGMLVVLDAIYNRILRNRKRGRATYIFIDEIYLLFSSSYSANFLFEQWKRARKYHAFYTGISQNVSDLLGSQTASTMLANSEMIILLNQAATDKIELAKLLGISGTQLSFVSNSDAGRGLLKCAGNIVPFENHFPKDSALYRIMTTKPKEAAIE